jgi:hypothetical protein
MHEQHDAADWCKAHGVKLDAVNENLPEMVELYGEDTRKIFASEYWDDRARKMPSNGCKYFSFPNGCKADGTVVCGYQRDITGGFDCVQGLRDMRDGNVPRRAENLSLLQRVRGVKFSCH